MFYLLASQRSNAEREELQEAVETYKTKTDGYLRRLEEAEIAKAKAVRAEAFGMCSFLSECIARSELASSSEGSL